MGPANNLDDQLGGLPSPSGSGQTTSETSFATLLITTESTTTSNAGLGRRSTANGTAQNGASGRAAPKATASEGEAKLPEDTRGQRGAQRTTRGSCGVGIQAKAASDQSSRKRRSTGTYANPIELEKITSERSENPPVANKKRKTVKGEEVVVKEEEIPVPVTATYTPAQQASRLKKCIQDRNDGLRYGWAVTKYYNEAMPGNEALRDITLLQWELGNLSRQAPSAAQEALVKSAKSFVDDDFDLLTVQLKVARVILKKAVQEYQEIQQAAAEAAAHADKLSVEAEKAKRAAAIRQKLLRELQEATGDTSQTLEDLA
ncbi:hypothetical protein B0A48_05150 [Cryoendolithus antarcticus]|uniref:Uncharacterized protein n=1 Tax=Cryoendolithus antarcticus TaxID=1507870 RepID=A0A1V8TEC7_9PEZI|nr:hypothetical protein B0A48_05150 [Cryoendolithus antarcticus]